MIVHLSYITELSDDTASWIRNSEDSGDIRIYLTLISEGHHEYY